MAECPSCSAPLASGANFCPNCGAKVASDGAPGAREVRKTVTILFSDLASSTALGERLDPEQLRALMGRYFGSMAAVIERHGGTVEKFIGDAIMAVFGIPAVHEDDALRAVRASVEMRDALMALNAELRPRGLEIRTRTGINTGEVVTGDPASGKTLVTGDAVNTAARLEQAAEPGEILIGETTRRLVRDAITDEAVPSLALRGKEQPTVAYRLLEASPDAAGFARRLDAPIVGRDREIGLLKQSWGRVVEERSPQLFSILGAAGVGKSRLSGEFLDAIGGVTVLRGRCLPYGEGITYWALAEVLRSAAGIVETDDAEAARAKLDELVRRERGAERISPLLHEAVGLASAGATQDELFWAVRRTLEFLARQEPLVVVWDDLHWAQPTFLDLVEHLADWCRDVPLLILGMARPELLDLRPGWGGGKLNAITMLLEPLGAAATTALLLEIPGGAALPDGLRRRIAETAEGNPLFLEEIIRMLVDDGRLEQTDDGWRADPGIATVPVPGSISALLAARLDRLGIGERQVAERASVVGRVFERGAVVELTPPAERLDVTQRLLALVRKDLVRPEAEPGLAGDDAYRFRHLLVRDAVYEAMPKAERATLHVAFATWLERVTGDRIGEYEEVVAHHLERAYHYHAELGEDDVEEIGPRAAARLVAAARRVQMRGDMPAASALRRQALGLPMPSGQRVDLLVQQARRRGDLGEFDLAGTLLDEAEKLIADSDDDALRMLVLVGRGFHRVHRGEHAPVERIAEDARRAARLLEEAGDAVGVARAHELAALAAYFGGDIMAARAGWQAAAEWARRSGDHGEAARILPALPATAMYGWATSAEAIEYCRQLADEYPDSPMLHARILAIMALQHAWRGELDVALRLRQQSRALLDELGLPWLTGEIHWDYADIDLARGAWEEAEREGRAGHEMTSRVGWPNAWELGMTVLHALHGQGRDGEARAWLDQLEAMPGTDTSAGRAYLPAWTALLAAVNGETDAARRALEAFGRLGRDPTEDATLLELRAEALALLGDHREALELYGEAASIYHRKEYFQLEAGIRRRMERLASPSG